MSVQATVLSQQNGVLVLNKPKGPTSAACIAKIKHQLSQKKIGHAGTLDPMASGVLLVLLGQATKLSGFLMTGGEKRYAGTVQLGVTTDTWDAEGKIIAIADASSVTTAMIEESVAAFIGTTEQQVPPYSAAKHKGKPLYELARKGLDVPEKKKSVYVSNAEIEWVDFPQFRFRVTCSSGTYIRSLAHSLGIRLGCGAVLTELTREFSYPFSLTQAHDLEDILATPELFSGKVASIADALPGWPRISVSEDAVSFVKNGMPLPCSSTIQGKVILEDSGGTALALASSKQTERGWAYVVERGLWQ